MNSLPLTRWAPPAWIWLMAAAVMLVAFRLHAFSLPLETDESNYAYIGARLLAGDRLYVDVWDHQPPGVFMLFAGAIALFGDDPLVFRWLATGFSLASLVCVFLLIRRLATSGAAACGAMLFALASSDPGTAGEGCNREIYMNAAVLAAWCLALVPRGATKGRMFLAGCALALGSFVKTVVAVHWLLLALWIILRPRLNPRTGGNAASTAKTVASFAAGPILLWGGALGYFAVADRLTEFVDAVFLFNLGYSGTQEAFWHRFARFFAPERHPFIFDSALPLWIGGAAACAWMLWEVACRRSASALAILCLGASGYVAACLPGRFWPHYYYLMIPPLVIAVSMGTAGCATRLRAVFAAQPAFGKAAVACVYLMVPLCLAMTQYRDYLSQPPFGITVKRYNSRDFWGRAQGHSVQRVTDPGDEIFVYGHDTAIYYYSKRRCASRYTMITGLQAGSVDVDRRRDTLLAELLERRPRLIVVLFDEPPFPAWKQFLQKYYDEPVGWDFHDRTGEPIMLVLARKDQPIETIDWNWDRSSVGGWLPGERGR